MVRKTAKGHTHGLMGESIKVNTRKVRKRAKGSYTVLINPDMKVSGRMTSGTVRVLSPGPMVKTTKETTRMERERAKESTPELMAEVMKANS